MRQLKAGWKGNSRDVGAPRRIVSHQ